MGTASEFQDMRSAVERETYQDGLLEIAAGTVFLVVALATGRPAFYWTYLAVILVLGPGLKRLKARFTYPRIGYVQLSDENPQQLRRGLVSWFLGVFLLIAVVLTLTGHVTDHLAWRRAAPALGGLLFSGGFLYVAQRSRLWRHYFLSAASVAFGILMTWPQESERYGNLRVWAMLMALSSLAMGGWVLLRFLREHPIVVERSPDVQ